MKITSKKPFGDIRQSQIVTTFGPGAMVDLPHHSVLIGGLESWTLGGEVIVERRLTEKLARILDVPSVSLKTPPPSSDDPTAPATGIVAFQFPEWFVTQDLEKQGRAGVRSRLLVHRKALTKGRFIDRDKKKRVVVPIRFVRACRAGHIGDIDWYQFVHRGAAACARQQRQLFLDELGTSGDLSEISVRCECRLERPLVEAANTESPALGHCDGKRPWLGMGSAESCHELSRLLIRSASNAYFSQHMTVISLPDRDEAVEKSVDAVWDFLEAVEDPADLQHERKKAKVKSVLDGISDEEALAAIRRRKSGDEQPDKPVKVAELETLLTSKDEFGGDRPEGVFYARALPSEKWQKPWMTPIERVVLVHRLREVVAQVGFTRFEPAAPDVYGELDAKVKRAALALEPTWLPAYENRGEGIFLQFRTAAIQEWLSRDAVKKRATELMCGFKAWEKEHPGSRRQFPDLAYSMLHSFAHLMITAVALRCGYPASAIRERVYAVPDLGYGVLLYTGATDAEGTLGGLIQVGRRIHESILDALQLGLLCSNDPVCAQHRPDSLHEHRYLHGAACHGCLLIAEPSCEQHNDFLDRSLVVPTVEIADAGIFPKDASNV